MSAPLGGEARALRAFCGESQRESCDSDRRFVEGDRLESREVVMQEKTRGTCVLALLALVTTSRVQGQEPEAERAGKTFEDVLETAVSSDWRTPDPRNVIYLELPAGRVIIELARRFAPEHAKNIVALAQERYWDGLAVLRAQDNFVVQWGDPNRDNEKLKRPIRKAKRTLPAEFERKADGLAVDRLPDADGWAPSVGFVDGMPIGLDAAKSAAWLTHCYGMVGAARGMESDSSNGSELYVVIGHSPRQLDRNITLVGRVVYGIEHLSTLPRGTGPLGFYETPDGAKPGPGPRSSRFEEPQRTPIRTIRVAADVPEEERTDIEVLRTDTELFGQLLEVRRNRREEWYKRSAGYVDLCNVPIPTRLAPK